MIRFPEKCTLKLIISFSCFHSLYIERPHSSIHDMIGGDMGLIHSPNDPFFFMHHVKIDSLWRQWQAASPQNRLTDYYGNLGNADDYDGPFRANLNDNLRYFNLIPDMKVRDVMNIQGGTFCYKVSCLLIQ